MGASCAMPSLVVLGLCFFPCVTCTAIRDVVMAPRSMSCTMARTHRSLQGTPTLVGTAVSNDPHGFIRVPLVGSRAVLPDLRVTDSSEAMLSGRKPPLRLMMRAVYKDSLLPVPHIRHAISEGFVVAVSTLHALALLAGTW